MPRTAAEKNLGTLRSPAQSPFFSRNAARQEAFFQTDSSVQRQAEPFFQATQPQPQASETPASDALPGELQSGVEQLSGMDMSDVKVHYNSSQPAKLDALAYARGTNIHLSPGQEKHLPHEAWHVVQQKQGRVRPTTQLKGEGINDDSSLEREADEMGGKAVQMRGAVNNGLVADRAEVQSPAYQLIRAIDIRPDYDANDPTFQDLMDGESDFAGNKYDHIKWSVVAQAIYGQINTIKEQVEDDEDIALVTDIESRTDQLVDNGHDAVTDFDSAEVQEGRRSRSRSRDAFSSYKKRGRSESPPSRDRSASPPRRQDETRGRGRKRTIYKIAVIKTIATITRELHHLKDELKRSFSFGEGGFSAKGRAHDIETSDVPKAKFTADSHYLKEKAVYKKYLKALEFSSAPVIDSQKNPAIDTTKKLELIKDLESKGIKKDISPQPKVPYKNTPAKKDRDGGQAINMGKTNASAYAMLTDLPGWENSKWEWLHIRASSLGGATDGTNLVVGTRDANTHMMPFEAHIKHIATEIGKNPSYEKIEVDFSFTNKGNPARHKVDTIKFDWRVYKTGKADPVHIGAFTFLPLNTSSSISKNEVEKLEQALKATREKL